MSLYTDDQESFADTVRLQFRSAMQDIGDKHMYPAVSCPVCLSCPVCSVNKSHNQIKLSMPSNWTKTLHGRKKKYPNESSSYDFSNHQWKEQVLELRGIIKRQSTTIHELETCLADSQQQIKELSGVVNSSSSKLEALESKVINRDNKCRQYKERLEALSAEIESKDSRITELEKQLALSESCRSKTVKELSRFRRQKEIPDEKKVTYQVEKKLLAKVEKDLSDLVKRITLWESTGETPFQSDQNWLCYVSSYSSSIAYQIRILREQSTNV